MNKKELVSAIADETSLSQKDVGLVLDSFIEQVQAAVAKGDSVKLVGFGTFERRERKERTGRNPRTGEALKIPASKVPAFSAGQQFKEAVNAEND